ncbi:Methyltransferase [Pseudonocardia sp. Ae168_Ps1]|uniref:class I SAM-dependent methyltransferase n=1 Tax=unclassified Pseudonocardia TaxID=2619320 RepID=UPI00094B2654|nr:MULTISPECIES: class I SAM-dependent methyltransferase [unclassified Pseudonocardia]OLL74444.1 Methyltransferase [Pseudonocardia sp. Ae150A_Ps1]OLL80424.1 Methyltransferase [Pseudonocardia sp. Ae168_Ps1]OLL85449.1 Methyltransferase [Pseudonocardia sp. Ae263_Ps1]OLL94524.1 Methyltransferase [Pseudonocardia sp. Ae356_Ps1]
MVVAPDLDAGHWLARWDAQQTRYVPDREDLFGLALDVVAGLDAGPGRLLDLACGPGSLASRAADRFPGAEIVGVDVDPVMLELARRTTGDRVRWVDADLSGPEWTEQVGGPFDAAVSATGLHWLQEGALPALAAQLAGTLRPGGVFVNVDTLLADPAAPRLAALTRRLREQRTERGLATGEDFRAWWDALADEPALATEFAERERRFADHVAGGSTLPAWEDALRGAGFAEVGTLTQTFDRRMLVAIR